MENTAEQRTAAAGFNKVISMPDRLKKIIRRIVILPLSIYKTVISPILPKACIYTPTCSEYAMGAIRKFGIFKGFALGLARLFRCNSLFFNGGNDPVPDTFSFKLIRKEYSTFFNKKKINRR
jgi:uncharacterized protein